LKIQHIAVVTTAIVIVGGFAMISPLFFRHQEVEPRQNVMLGFSIAQSDQVMEWCEGLSELLSNYNIGASLFMVGKVAEEYPDAVWYFNNRVDVGSQTYSNIDLTGISDYSLKLEEVKEGKNVVDGAGTLNSRIFRAPYGATDQDIYSLLSRAGILVDFSYENSYNVYRDGQFIKYDARTYFENADLPTTFSKSNYSAMPVIVFFDNSKSITEIDSTISRLKKANVKFVNASELTGLILTERGK